MSIKSEILLFKQAHHLQFHFKLVQSRRGSQPWRLATSSSCKQKAKVHCSSFQHQDGIERGKSRFEQCTMGFPNCPVRFRFPHITYLQNSDMTSLLPKLPKKSKLGKSKSERQFLFKALKILEGLWLPFRKEEKWTKGCNTFL